VRRAHDSTTRLRTDRLPNRNERMTTTNVDSDPSEGAGVNEPHVSDAVSANARDGRATTSRCGCGSFCEDLRDLPHERPQSWPPQDGALAGPPQQPQPMLPGLEGC
jgi:hypothetical protein